MKSERSGPSWGLGRLGLERATLRTTPYGWPLKTKRSLFPDWPLLCDESSTVTTQKGSAHSCSNFDGKIQNGVPANC